MRRRRFNVCRMLVLNNPPEEEEEEEKEKDEDEEDEDEDEDEQDLQRRSSVSSQHQ